MKKRYIVNKLRQEFGFRGTPIRMFVRDNEEDELIEEDVYRLQKLEKYYDSIIAENDKKNALFLLKNGNQNLIIRYNEKAYLSKLFLS